MDVYECWVFKQDDTGKDTFGKFTFKGQVMEWAEKQFDQLGMHDRMTIVKHDSKEYHES